MKVKYIIILVVMMQSITLLAQQEQSPLFKFLQQEADSTLVFVRETSHFPSMQLQFLSKKGDTISMYNYRYEKPIRLKHLSPLPETIRKKIDSMYKHDFLSNVQYSKPAEFDMSFKPQYVCIDSVSQFWGAVSLSKPWGITDKGASEWCPDDLSKRIYDAGYIILYRITKGTIEKLSFYAPEYFESPEGCPGNPNRIAILKINNLFKAYFKAIRKE